MWFSGVPTAPVGSENPWDGFTTPPTPSHGVWTEMSRGVKYGKHEKVTKPKLYKNYCFFLNISETEF